MRQAIFIPSLVAVLLGASSLAQAQESTPPQPLGPSSVSRDAVRADLQAWKASGLEQAWRGENTPDLSSPSYRAMTQHYAQLTRSQYAQAPAAPTSRHGG